MCLFDVRQRRQRSSWTAHSHAVSSLAPDRTGQFAFSTSADGDIKLWSLGEQQRAADEDAEPAAHWPRAHEPHTMLSPVSGTKLGRTYGVNQLVRDETTDRVFTVGADGRLLLWRVLGA